MRLLQKPVFSHSHKWIFKYRIELFHTHINVLNVLIYLLLRDISFELDSFTKLKVGIYFIKRLCRRVRTFLSLLCLMCLIYPQDQKYTRQIKDTNKILRYRHKNSKD